MAQGTVIEDDAPEELDSTDLEQTPESEREPARTAPATPAPKATRSTRASKDETVTVSKREFEQLNRRLSETETSERYWANLARSGGKPPASEPDPDEVEDEDDQIEDDDPDKLMDEFTNKGISALVKRGVMTKKDAKELFIKIARKEAREAVGIASRKATQDSKILGQFPELKDKNSELFLETRKELLELVELDPDAANSPTALYAAAKAAKARIDAAARRGTGRRRVEERYEYEGDDEPEDTDEELQDRRRRANAQGASRGRQSRAELEDDDRMSPALRTILAGMHPDKNEADRFNTFKLGKKIIESNGAAVNGRLR